MSESIFISPVSHHRRIRDLERLADAQRELLGGQLDELSHSFRPLEVTRSIFTHLGPVATFASRLLGGSRFGLGLAGALGALGLGTAAVESVEARRFPWKTAVLAGTSLAQVFHWLKNRRPRAR
jgi:hypothetical protein